jgi:hypothetical protein
LSVHSAFADFNTLGLISAYFAWRRGRGRSRRGRYGKWPVLGAILSVWIFSLSLASIPLLGVYGGMGYNAVNGKCQIIQLEGNTLSSHVSGVIFTVGSGVPFIVMLISYGLVYRSLYQNHATDVESIKNQKAVMILTFCYFIFVIPVSIIELVPENLDHKEWISLGLFFWHCLIYILNPFLYCFSEIRIRTATVLMFKDVFEVSGYDWETRSNISVPWWLELQSTDLSTDLSTTLSTTLSTVNSGEN